MTLLKLYCTDQKLFSDVIRSTTTNSRLGSTLDFIFEDMTTDSTSVLKDRRHPSLSSVNVGTFQTGPKLGRVVSFNRSKSSVQKSGTNTVTTSNKNTKNTSKRPRYMSEGHDNDTTQEIAMPQGTIHILRFHLFQIFKPLATLSLSSNVIFDVPVII